LWEEWYQGTTINKNQKGRENVVVLHMWPHGDDAPLSIMQSWVVWTCKPMPSGSLTQLICEQYWFLILLLLLKCFLKCILFA